MVTAAAALAVAPGVAVAQVQPYGTGDYGGFRDVLPPGTNGLDTLAQLGAFRSTGARPAHNNDQLQMYSGLTTAAGSITAATLPDYFKDATFGVPSGNVGSSESPAPGVTIVRDKQYGVPHIYGDTRTGLMFGIGYATAEDRLFFIDVLRHAGEGALASFAGGANVGMDQSVWANEPYTPQDLANQVDYGIAHTPDGAQIHADEMSYVDGINAYINQAAQPLNMLTMEPAEYAALGQTGGPKPFTLENLVSIATLVGGIFGGGGGHQLANAMLYENLTRRFGAEHFPVAGTPTTVSVTRTRTHGHGHGHGHRRGHRRSRTRRGDHSGLATLLSFNAPNDPEAPTTVAHTVFPYQALPKPSRAVARTIALPDLGSVTDINHVVAGAAPALARGARSAQGARAVGSGLGTAANVGPGLLAFPSAMSNALLVSARNSASGYPLAVMGPQVGYFAPQILMEEDIHGPGIDAAGAAFPGVNLYVELGHGTDYAWSATSAGQNIVDTFAVPLCNPAGGSVAPDSGYYLLHGRCVAMETLTNQESWSPSLADSTPAGSITLQTQRTAFGLVTSRARIKGRPVVYTRLRSTYMHELDSAAGFEKFNEPAAMRTPQAFMSAANEIGYTFNWFYTNNAHIAYFNSGLNPVRAAHTNPLFPTWSRYAWSGLHPSALTTPASLIERDLGQNAHPQVIDQSVLTSWNNKQARGYGDPATGQQFSSVYRSQLLDNNLGYYARQTGGKLTLPDLVNAMGLAGTQDLRGVEVLPYALKILGPQSDPALATAVAQLSAWAASGSHRINRANPEPHGNYEQTDAIRIMDAWWPLLVRAQFTPVLGADLLNQIEAEFPINDQPGHGGSGAHLGSSWDVGFYGIVQKDLRTIAHQRVAGRLNRVYCGAGSLVRCRAALQSSLSQAIAQTAEQVYPADGVCPAGDQMCSDSIQFRAIGGITQPLIEWVNRPTFQQADEIQGHAGG